MAPEVAKSRTFWNEFIRLAGEVLAIWARLNPPAQRQLFSSCRGQALFILHLPCPVSHRRLGSHGSR